MRCLKIQHQVQIYSLCAFLFSCLFCVFGLSQDSSALEMSCTFDNNLQFSSCPGLVISDYKYFKITHVIATIQYNANDPANYNYYSIYLPNNPQSSAFRVGYKRSNGLHYINLDVDSTYLPLFQKTYYEDGSSPTFSITQNAQFATWAGNNASIVSYKFDVTFYDDIPSAPSEPCPVCPELPENPYDNKLDDIKKAIYAVGASLFVLYFFFCIYKIIVKDGGLR